MMILMIWVIKSCKWRTPLSHLYCWCFGDGDDYIDRYVNEDEEEDEEDDDAHEDDEDDLDSNDSNDQELQVAHTSEPSVLSMGGQTPEGLRGKIWTWIFNSLPDDHTNGWDLQNFWEVNEDFDFDDGKVRPPGEGRRKGNFPKTWQLPLTSLALWCNTNKSRLPNEA